MLIEFIRENWDIFAWKPSDMPGVPRQLEALTTRRSINNLINTGEGKRICWTSLALIEFIRGNRDIFAWKPSDMPGVPRQLAEHTLNVDPK